MKIVIADVKEGRNYQRELTDSEASTFYGKKINDKFDGALVGFDGYEFEITGGSDKQGFPMRKGIISAGRVKAIISKGPGLRKTKKGFRVKKTLRGGIISPEIIQLNVKVVKYGPKKISEIMPSKPEKESEKKKS